MSVDTKYDLENELIRNSLFELFTLRLVDREFLSDVVPGRVVTIRDIDPDITLSRPSPLLRMLDNMKRIRDDMKPESDPPVIKGDIED